MDKFLINSTLVYRVPTVEDALKLRDILSETPYGELTNFSYTTKYIKAKGEVIEEYQVVKAKIEFNADGDLVLQINGVSKVFSPKADKA